MLKTDFYQLTMANGYLKNGFKDRKAVFHFFFRKNPFGGGYAIASGLSILLNYIEKGKFPKAELDFLSTLTNSENNPVFDDSFLKYLEAFKFTVDVYAVPEGTIVFEYEPLVRVEGSLIECQILETLLSNIINFSTLISTKASRMYEASDNGELIEFGYRRAQGVDGALTASRAAYIGGFSSTSNVEAGKVYNIPLRGTHSHSWVLTFDNESEAFQAYYNTYPKNCVFLLDTYNTMEGLKKAVQFAKKVIATEDPEFKLLGVRIDSGDLAYLSNTIRKFLNAEGFTYTKIIAGNDLDEYIIESLQEQGATIDIWAVGTKLVTAYEQPALGGVYKLSCIQKNGEWENKIKLSEDSAKINIPGRLQIRRYSKDNQPAFDVIYDINTGEPVSGSNVFSPINPLLHKKINPGHTTEDLLVKVANKGQIVYESPSIEDMRRKSVSGIKIMDRSVKRFINPHYYPAGLEEKLYTKRNELIASLKSL